MLSWRHSIGHWSPLEPLAKESKSVPYIRCYARPPRTEICAHGILLPIELAFMMILINDRELMGNHVNGPVLNTLAWGTTFIISLLAISLLVITVLLPIFGVHLG